MTVSVSDLDAQAPDDSNIPVHFGKMLVRLCTKLGLRRMKRLHFLLDFTEFGVPVSNVDGFKRAFIDQLTITMQSIPFGVLGAWPSEHVDVVVDQKTQEQQYHDTQQHTPNQGESYACSNCENNTLHQTQCVSQPGSSVQSILHEMYWPHQSLKELKCLENIEN